MRKSGADAGRQESLARSLLRERRRSRRGEEYPYYSESQLRRYWERESPLGAEELEDEPEGCGAVWGEDETVEEVLRRWLMPLGLGRREWRMMELRAAGRSVREIARRVRGSRRRVGQELRRVVGLLRRRRDAMRLTAGESIAAQGMARGATAGEIAMALGLDVWATRRIMRRALEKIEAYRLEEARQIRRCYWEDVHRTIYRPPARLRLRVTAGGGE